MNRYATFHYSRFVGFVDAPNEDRARVKYAKMVNTPYTQFTAKLVDDEIEIKGVQS